MPRAENLSVCLLFEIPATIPRLVDQTDKLGILVVEFNKHSFVQNLAKIGSYGSLNKVAITVHIDTFVTIR